MDNLKQNILTLTAEQKNSIVAWIEENGFSFSEGNFELVVSFCVLGPEIRFHWKPSDGDYGEWLDLNLTKAKGDTEAPDRLEICGRIIDFSLPYEIYRTWLCSAAERTEAELNADCEPSGTDLHFRIEKNETLFLVKESWLPILEIDQDSLNMQREIE